ncbi:PLP-dependent aminotransferase family protein [Pseudalkalibacillus berkeleyi]|uniref:PLP-dependent aminotransferase family protein n=1 Tax=Pseudalkalibacillus berkeleyi TaxID=1069813 RepID=A0ABS9H5J7_9BACL|nr:PLP-dependent aminotransferase family protein [Pseudalkalibacillus berkeleyi]MCF6139158.1 PLP-dependent aminotransferase family protein [Pseudalkalibacillus berkeleyi]
MKLVVQKDSATPIHQQIYHQVLNRIQTGSLPDGEKMPSLRKLSNELDVNYLTVNKVYQRLEEERHIEILQGKGAFVRSRHKTKPFIDGEKEQEVFSTLLQRSQYLVNRSKSHYDFSKAVVSPGLLPSHFLAQQTKAIIDQNPMILTTYGPVEGDEELREEVAIYVEQQLGYRTEANDILITSGVQQGINIVANTFLSPTDTVAVESPCYGAAIDTFMNKGNAILPIEMDDEGMRMDVLETHCRTAPPKLVYVNPTFQNPTARTMSERRRKELLELAETYNFLIIEDDSFSEVYFDGVLPPKPIKYFDSTGHCIFLKGFSKTMAPGIRLGAIIADESLYESLYISKASMDVGSPLLNQKALLPFMKTKRMKDHLEKLRIALQIRRDMTIEILDVYLNGQIRYEQPKGGLNLWVELPDTIDVEALQRLAKEHSISFLPGSACYVTDSPTSSIRLSYSTLSDRENTEGITQLASLIASQLSRS